MIESIKAVSVLRDGINYLHYKDCPDRLIRLTKTAGEGLAVLIEHQQAEIKRLTDANEFFTGAGLRYEDEIAQKDASIQRIQSIIANLSQELKDAIAVIVRYRQWVNDLQSGMTVNCVYCGHSYGPAEDTPVSMADVLKEHIDHCTEHPMSKLKVENERLTAEVDRLTQERDAAVRDCAQFPCVTCDNREYENECRHCSCEGQRRTNHSWRGSRTENAGTNGGERDD